MQLRLFILIALSLRVGGLGAAPMPMPEASAIPLTPSAALPLPAIGPADRDKQLSVGDQVTFAIAEDKEPPALKRVTDTGDLDVPYVGRVHVAGKTCATAAREIKKLLDAEYYYNATVKLGIDQVNRAAAMGKIYVSGLVKSPGAQEFYTGEKMSVSAVILKAGGFAQYADTKGVKVVRKARDGRTDSFVVDMKAVLERGKMDQDVEVFDGDYVIVPQRLWNY